MLPEPQIDERIMTIPGLDGQKMSKVVPQLHRYFPARKRVEKDHEKILSDSTALEEPKNPDTDITFQLYSLIAEEADVETMRQKYLNGGYGYGSMPSRRLLNALWKYSLSPAGFSIIIWRTPKSWKAFWWKAKQKPVKLHRKPLKK